MAERNVERDGSLELSERMVCVAGEVSVEGKPKEHIVWRQVQRASLWPMPTSAWVKNPADYLARLKVGRQMFGSCRLGRGPAGGVDLSKSSGLSGQAFGGYSKTSGNICCNCFSRAKGQRVLGTACKCPFGLLVICRKVQMYESSAICLYLLQMFDKEGKLAPLNDPASWLNC